ncbi:40s ribosomal protein S21 [Cryptosporidium andersoni]|uniref:40S ribosomal protein S21 n=1 Tax=Cryptosporidium andersoni TaxID=117008 RepID=A0A1J4MN61_9CRYT|nr:40s ribosomal protein S21 [Cryptosporidium andersoni]
MQNIEGKVVDLYIPRKCSATKRLIAAKEHGAVQIDVAVVDDEGVATGQVMSFAISGAVRQRGESDGCLNRLFHEKQLLSFSR